MPSVPLLTKMIAPSSDSDLTTNATANTSRMIHAPLHQQQPPPLSLVPLDQALITLNNIAIELMQRGHHPAAFQTFQDALQVQKTTADAAHIRTALQQAQSRSQEATMASASSVSSSRFVVLSSATDAVVAYQLLVEQHTSLAFVRIDPPPTLLDDNLRMDSSSSSSSSNNILASLVRSIVVYNYGIAHRCVGTAAAASNNDNRNPAHVASFCVQVFQYAESLLSLPEDPSFSWDDTNNNNNHYCNNLNLMFRYLLTRNLMMLSCRLGMSICEQYKETLDPIEDRLVRLSSDQNHNDNRQRSDHQAPAA